MATQTMRKPVEAIRREPMRIAGKDVPFGLFLGDVVNFLIIAAALFLFISKFLGQEIMRIFALEHDLEVPTLVFGPFTNPEDCEPDQLGCYPFLVSWADAAEAVRGALRAPSFPRPFEVFHILADLPHASVDSCLKHGRRDEQRSGCLGGLVAEDPGLPVAGDVLDRLVPSEQDGGFRHNVVVAGEHLDLVREPNVAGVARALDLLLNFGAPGTSRS